MMFGSVAYYLSLMDSSLSLTQNIDNLYFDVNGPFRRETETRQSLYLTLITAAPLSENACSNDIPVKLDMNALFG